MNGLRARIWRYAPLIVLIGLAVYPILSGGLPTTGDGLNHFYRVAELDWQIRHGDFYPRWFANMGYGFGMPVLNFYSPLSYYIALIFHWVGFSLATALQLGYVLALGVAIVGAYMWGRDLWKTEWAGLLTAAGYGLAPYFYFNIFHRGAYPETWAMALMPWLSWLLERVVRQPKRTEQIALIGLLAALVLTHTLSALMFAPVLIIYFLALWIPMRGEASFWKNFGRVSLAAILALALAAFFVLPLALEAQDIQLQRTYSTGDLDYHRNFLTLGGLLAAPPNFDPHLVFNAMPPSLGWPQVALAVIGLGLAIALYIKQRRFDWKIMAIAVLLLIGSALTLGFSLPIWEAVSVVGRFIQFPWRLVGPVSLLVAVLAGGVAAYPKLKRSGLWMAGAGMVAFFFFSLPWTYHANFVTPTYNSPDDTINYEITSGELGTSSSAEYLPKTVSELPDSNTFAGQFTNDAFYSRMQALPAGLKSAVSKNSVNSETLTYESPMPIPVTYNLFYFPGWAATLDGQPIKVSAAPTTGLITLTAPAGTHALTIDRVLTAPQLGGSLISMVTLLGLIVWAVWKPGAVEELESSPVLEETGKVALALGGLGLILLFARIGYFDRTETAFHHTNAIPNPTSVNFSDQLELIGYAYEPTVPASESVPVTLYWRASQALTTDYSVSVQLADKLGNRFGQADSQHPNGVPTSRWGQDQYARDVHNLAALEGTPPGMYQLLVTAYAKNGPLSILTDGAPSGIDTVLGEVQVGAPAPGKTGPLTLTSFEVVNKTVAVGDQLALTAVWFSGNAPLPDLNASLSLVDDAGKTIFTQALPPAGPDYPTPQWVRDTAIRYPLSITLPPDLPGGTVHLRLGLTTASGEVAAGPFELGALTITVPERTFEIPPMQVRTDHDFAGTIRLLGYEVKADSITLYWQALKTVSQRLTVFVHTLNGNGSVNTGNDAQPVRPTTGWLAGEVIVDRHPLAVGAHFEVGLYDPITHDRFGETFVTSP
jgi:6-pyruvoyl-tetrahydropterin synthase related domain